MKKNYVRHIVVFEDHFKVFRQTISRDALKKVYHVLTLIMTVETIPERFFKAVKERKGLYEIRVDYEGNIYRIFCCFDAGNLIILFNGFQKKTQKTPTEQLDKAEALMKEYFSLKNKQQ